MEKRTVIRELDVRIDQALDDMKKFFSPGGVLLDEDDPEYLVLSGEYDALESVRDFINDLRD